VDPVGPDEPVGPEVVTPAVTLSKAVYTYNGKVRKPIVTVSVGDTVLRASEYTVEYAPGRKNVGTYEIIVSLTGKYTGCKTVSFKINPKPTTLKRPIARSKGFTAKWAKRTIQTTGYQLQYSTSKYFPKGRKTKTKTVSKNKIVSKKVSRLKAKKKYYVRIRTYKTVNGKRYYSTWSTRKAVTTKR
jgi:hypothetical protein